jgi:hypothetical protein
MRQTTVFVALSALGVAVAQSNFTIDPSVIDPTTRSEAPATLDPVPVDKG